MIRARAAVVAAIGGVEYKLPVAAVSYVLIAASAYQDSSGLYQYKVDFATVADQALITFVKSVSDGVSTSEAIQNYVLEKGISDEIELTETVNILITVIVNLASEATVEDVYASLFATLKTETITTSDGSVWSFEKGQAETLTASDTVASTFNAPKDETVEATDTSEIGYSKPQSETVTSEDSFDRVAEFSRDFDEPQTILENKAVDLTKPIFDERLFGTLNAVPVNTLAVNDEYLEDEFFVYMSDSVDVLLVIERSLADSFDAPTDTLSSAVDKSLSDSASTEDSLSYVVQSYNPHLFNTQVLNNAALSSSY